MPNSKKATKRLMSDLKVQKDEDEFEYVLLDPLTAHFSQPVRAVLFGLVSKSPHALPQEGYIIPFPAFFSFVPEIINELEIRATEGLALNH